MQSRFNSLGALFEGWAQVLPPSAAELAITGLTHEVDCVQPGSAFALLDGPSPVTHALIEQAIAAGAIAILTDAPSEIGDARPVISATDVRRAFATATRRLAQSPDRELAVIAVTGTNGKTTTVHALGQVLASLGGCGRIGTHYLDDGGTVRPYDKTTPEAGVVYPTMRRMLTNGCRYAAMEASSHGLTQQRLFGMTLRYGIFTNLSQDHLDYHGDMSSYLAAKQSLFAMLPAEALAILNSDDPAGRAMPVPAARRLFYGTNADADLRFELHAVEEHGSVIEFSHTSQRASVRSQLLGLHNAYNLAGVLGVLLGEGLELSEAARLLERVDAPPGRLERIRGPGFDVFVDYAHSPDALDKVLTALRLLGPRCLRVVFGAGGCKDAGKRPQMGELASRLADRVYLTSDNPRSEAPQAIIDDIAAGMRGEWISVVDRREAIALALREAQAGDLVLVAGKGHETYQEIDGVRHPFDDRRVVRALLADMEMTQ